LGKNKQKGKTQTVPKRSQAMTTSLERQWQDFFWSGFYAKAWRSVIDPQKTQEEVTAVLKLLNPAPGSHILDWCGGEARHSILLALQGYKVTLLDFAPNHIQTAREMAEQAGVHLNLVCCDFRETPSFIQADCAINMFTAGIGYLTEEDDVQALKSLYAALKPGAKFLLDTMNLFWLVRHYQPNSGEMAEKTGSWRKIEQRRFDFWTNRNQAVILYWDKGGETIQETDLRIYSAAELIAVLRRAGFEPLQLYGGFDGSPLGFDSRRLIIVSQRK